MLNIIRALCANFIRALCVIFFFALLTACGGGGGNSVAAPTTPTPPMALNINAPELAAVHVTDSDDSYYFLVGTVATQGLNVMGDERNLISKECG